MPSPKPCVRNKSHRWWNDRPIRDDFADHPSDFVDPGTRFTPEQRLLWAILAQALQDAADIRASEREADRIRSEAREFFARPNGGWHDLAEALGLEEHVIRRIEQCARGERKLFCSPICPKGMGANGASRPKEAAAA